MASLTQLRIAAREIFDETLRALDPYAAVQAALAVNESRLSVGDISLDIANRNVYAIAIGKAARRMAAALDEVLGERLCRAVISSNDSGLTGTRLPSRWIAFLGGHPEPNESSLAAAQAAFDLLDRANDEHAVVIFLISGGGSAMLEWPISADISLADLRAANQVLVNCGASIIEINAVRRKFSTVKGGKLAARAPNADQITLIVSDVPAGEEQSVASGPTLAPSPNAPFAMGVVGKYNLRSHLPPAILRAIDSTEPSPTKLSGVREHSVLLDNQTAVDAAAEAARRREFITEVASDILDQGINEGCELLLRRLRALRAKHHESGKIVCLISGGEFSCPATGDGCGGRNLETALRLAALSSSLLPSDDLVALCAGTDGIDGNSPAAGAIADNTTIERAQTIGLNAEDFLRSSDSYSFFVALGDAVTTGPTGTNVRDIRILLSST